MNDLIILLNADLNKGKSIGDINKSIKEIQKSGLLKDLKLSVDIDQGFQKAIKEFTKSANQLQKIIEQQNRVISTETSTIKDAEGAVVSVTRKRLANGEVITETTKKVEKSVQAQKQEIRVTEDLTDRLEDLANARKKAEAYNLDKDGNVTSTTSKYGDEYSTLTERVKPDGTTSYRIEENYEKQYQDELKLQQAIERIEKKRIKDVDAAEYDAYKEKEKREKNLHGNRIQDQKLAYDLAIIEDNKFNQKRMDNLHKQALAENKQFDERIHKEQEFLRKQQDSLNKLAIAQQKFGHHAKVAANLQGVKGQIEAITFATRDWDNSFKNIDTHIKKSTAGFKAMRQESVGFIDGFSTAMVKFPIGGNLGRSKTSLIDWNALRAI